MIGRTLSHYRVLERLGAGGMGVVYKAEDTRLGRAVAIKLLSDELAKDRVAMERFEREARAASALNHPNICTIHDVDEVDGTPFLVMELLEGETLRESLDRGPLPPDRLLDVATELADALATAHEARIIHRDLKPANLFLTRLGHVKILDFGLAKLLHEHDDISDDAATQARDLTATATTVGTIAYMSPEQARAERLDARTDLFSLGAVLYELATGVRPFGAANAALTYDRILHHDPPPPTTPLAPIIMKALQKDRETRYQSAADMRADLERLEHDSQPTQVTGARPVRRTTAIIVAAVVVAIIAAVLWRTRPSSLRSTSRQQVTVAVLPFANLGAAGDRDYLRLALADELITILSHSHSLAVRPFALSRKFTADADPHQAGQSLNVSQVLTGHFRDGGGRIDVTLEAIDVEKNDVVWRGSINAPTGDLIAMRDQLSARIRGGFLPLLNGSNESSEPNRPRNDEAYALYLRAAAQSNDPVPNKAALDSLERAVTLDPSFAPAWAALASRAYYDGEYGEGGVAARHRSEEAAARALRIDPDLAEARRRLILLQAETADLVGAYRNAHELVQQRPDSGDAHFILSYTLRYAGLIDEAARECETARSLDRHNSGFRSCALTFTLLGDLDRAREYLQLDPGSSFSRATETYILMRAGDNAAVIQRGIQPNSTERRWWNLFKGYVDGRPPAELKPLAAEVKRGSLAEPDPEPSYFTAATLAVCRQDAEALDLLRAVVERGYCAHPAMDFDPAFARLRGTADFQKLRQASIDCQQRFLQARDKAR
jgi:serine/threonine protein kinase/Tfp pilus assembly protein PilF